MLSEKLREIFPHRISLVSPREMATSIFKSRNDLKYNLVYFFDTEKDQNEQIQDIEDSFYLASTKWEYTQAVDFLAVKNPGQKLKTALKISKTPSVMITYHNKIADEGYQSQISVNTNFLEIRKLTEQVF